MMGRRAERTVWDDRREELGLVDEYGRPYDRRWVAHALGMGKKTIERYELHKAAPTWYGLALFGLAVKLGRVKVRGRKKP